MRYLNLSNVDITITGPQSFGSGAQEMVGQVQFSDDTAPVERDLPSGAWWIWPIKQGQLVIQGVLAPNYVPLSTANAGNSYTITISGEFQGAQDTITIDRCILSGCQVNIEPIAERYMPALQVAYTFQVFIDDIQDVSAYPS